MAIQKEIWIAEIVEKLFPPNSWALQSVDHSGYVSNKTVHVPLAGTVVAVTKNRTPGDAGTPELRADTDLTYSIDEFATAPKVIPSIEEIETSYNKRGSITAELGNALSLAAHNELLLKWLPTAAGSFIRTTGTAAAAETPTATGNRNTLTLANVLAAVKALNNLSVGMSRNILLPTHMWASLAAEILDKNSMSLTSNDNFIAQGELSRLLGLNIYLRPSTQMPFYSNESTPVKKAVGTTLTTGCAAALVWDSAQVSRAIGTVDMFENIADAIYQGDIYSASVRCGGAIIGNGNAPIAIIEAIPA